MPLTKEGRLSSCLIETNCVLAQWEFANLNQSYDKLIKIAAQIPRTIVLEQSNNYWHGVCRSLIFRFPDDLEILKLPNEGLIEVRSASRIGLGDLGVNRNRVNLIHNRLMASV